MAVDTSSVPEMTPCSCGSSDLKISTARLGGAAYVWCNSCYLGTPAKFLPSAVANLETGQDARPLAIELWNAAMAGKLTEKD